MEVFHKEYKKILSNIFLQKQQYERLLALITEDNIAIKKELVETNKEIRRIKRNKKNIY